MYGEIPIVRWNSYSVARCDDQTAGISKRQLYLKTAMRMAISTDCTLAGAQSGSEEESPYIRALSDAV